MKLIDSHAHIFTEEFKEDIDQVIDRAASANVYKICMPNIDEKSIEPMLALSEKYPEICYPMMGLHPSSVTENYLEQLDRVKNYLDASDRYIAVGEIGIDLYWDKSLKVQQIEAFKMQAGWAVEKNLPIVIHSRESTDLLIEILEEMGDERPQGVFHCFTGTASQAEQIIGMGYYIGIGGILTFKNSELKELIPSIDLSRILLETDSPYLAPVPKRGKRNEPAYTLYVAEKLAEITGRSLTEIADITTRNAEQFYKW